MKKPNKHEIISCVQFMIMMYTMTMGFCFSYLLIWVKCGLPQELWAHFVIVALAFLSVFGLCTWIRSGGVNDG